MDIYAFANQKGGVGKPKEAVGRSRPTRADRLHLVVVLVCAAEGSVEAVEGALLGDGGRAHLVQRWATADP
jgi:hypothetical protein